MDNIEQKIFHGINLGNNCNYVGELEDIDIFADILKERKY